MKLAFFLPRYPVLSETFVSRQIKAMHERGHSVTVLTGHYDKALPGPLPDAIPIRLFRSSSKYRALRRALAITLKFPFSKNKMAMLRVCTHALQDLRYTSILDVVATSEVADRFDYIICHFGPAGVRAMCLRKTGLIRGKIVTIFHGFDISRYTEIKKYRTSYAELLRTTELQMPISQLWEQRLLEWGADREKVSVVHIGVDVATLKHQRRERSRGPLKVVSVARLVEKKGVEYAIEGIHKAGRAIDYRIVGDGPLRVDLEGLSDRLEVSASFLGSRPHGEALELIRSADVFLLPSVVSKDGDMEGIPVALMEAMASGVIVVATRHSGIPELIEHGKNGFLVDERDSDGIAKVLTHIIDHLDDLDDVRASAIDKVSSDFNNEVLDEHFENLLYDKLAA